MFDKRFILVREGRKDPRVFPNVTIRDTSILEPTTINGRPTRVYKRVSGVMHYLDAYPVMVRMNVSHITGNT